LQKKKQIIIKTNLSFQKKYKKLNVFIICPKKEIQEFKSQSLLKKANIISEESLISFKTFKSIFNKLSIKVKYKNKIKNRLKWYYQQILKLSFLLKFLDKKNKNLIIWDADTIILKKINFFINNKSILYGNFFEFHKQYYKTNSYFFDKKKYFISFLNQFIAVTTNEVNFLKKILLEDNKQKINKKSIYFLSKKIMIAIFRKHKAYNGSLFSEYELIGQSIYLMRGEKQIPILYLRNGLNGKLTKLQKKISIFLNFKHVTYEHSHYNIDSIGMLSRKLSWLKFFKLIIKNLIKFYLRKIRYNFKYTFLTS